MNIQNLGTSREIAPIPECDEVRRELARRFAGGDGLPEVREPLFVGRVKGVEWHRIQSPSKRASQCWRRVANISQCASSWLARDRHA